MLGLPDILTEYFILALSNTVKQDCSHANHISILFSVRLKILKICPLDHVGHQSIQKFASILLIKHILLLFEVDPIDFIAF